MNVAIKAYMWTSLQETETGVCAVGSCSQKVTHSAGLMVEDFPGSGGQLASGRILLCNAHTRGFINAALADPAPVKEPKKEEEDGGNG